MKTTKSEKSGMWKIYCKMTNKIINLTQHTIMSQKGF
jgi:hypothetical protein